MILVVGATGQLGTKIIRKLIAQGKPVRAFVRKTSDHQHLQSLGVELAFGDLRDAASVDAAVRGCDVVIATASSVIPVGSYSFEDIEGRGYKHLVDSCKKNEVKQFLFASAGESSDDEKVPTYRYKRVIERLAKESGVPFSIFRGAPFMDAWLIFIGGSTPLLNAEAATAARSFWFSRFYVWLVKGLIENWGIAVVAGNGKSRQAFIAEDDVATFMVKAIGHPKAMNAVIDLGGPEIVSWNEVVGIYGKVLNKKVRIIHVPAFILRMNQLIMGLFSQAAGNILGLNWYVAKHDCAFDMAQTARDFDVQLTTVEQFLVGKRQALPPKQ